MSLASLDDSAPAVPPTVLIVDDDPVTRAAMTARLKRLGLRILQAGNGKEGLALLRRARPDLTILDWMMPELDGPSFCEQVRGDPELRSSQILMMTSCDQPEQIAEGLMRGADDFVSKTASPHELAARVQAGMRTAGLIRQLEEATAQVRRKQIELEQELASAARYVESLLPVPGRLLPGIEMASCYRPSLALGGDLFNVVRWSDRSLGLYLLDASGHGVAPALRSASLSTFFRADSLWYWVGSSDPGAIVTEANRQFPLTEGGDYFTIIFVRLDIESSTISYAAAGHPGVLLHRRTGEARWLSQRSLPLGFDTSYVYRSADAPFEPGDRLYLLSDGLYEIPGPSGELWGRSRLEAAILSAGPRPLQEVLSRTLDEASRWCGRDHFPDDVAVMAIESIL